MQGLYILYLILVLQIIKIAYGNRVQLILPVFKTTVEYTVCLHSRVRVTRVARSACADRQVVGHPAGSPVATSTGAQVQTCLVHALLVVWTFCVFVASFGPLSNRQNSTCNVQLTTLYSVLSHVRLLDSCQFRREYHLRGITTTTSKVSNTVEPR